LRIDSKKYREGKVKKNPKESEIDFETGCFYTVEAVNIVIVTSYLLHNGPATSSFLQA